MITPKSPKPSKADNKRAYNLATERDNNTCQRCLRDCGPIARDHRQNRDPFNTTVDNLQCLGLECHQWKTEHPDDAIAEGWAVPRNTLRGPGEWPARRYLLNELGVRVKSWVLYDTAGSWVQITAGEAETIRAELGLVAA